MKFREPGPAQMLYYVIYGAIAIFVLAALAGGSGGFIAQMECVTATNPMVTVFLGLVLVFFLIGIALAFLPRLRGK